MVTSEELLREATAGLDAAVDGSVAGITTVMTTIERYAREVAAGHLSWDDARVWAAQNAERVAAARPAFQAWQLKMADFYHGGEEEAEWALTRRSQFEFMRDLFRGTAGEGFLENWVDEELDHDFGNEAQRLGLDPPDYVPRSHLWWRWRDVT